MLKRLLINFCENWKSAIWMSYLVICCCVSSRDLKLFCFIVVFCRLTVNRSKLWWSRGVCVVSYPAGSRLWPGTRGTSAKTRSAVCYIEILVTMCATSSDHRYSAPDLGAFRAFRPNRASTHLGSPHSEKQFLPHAVNCIMVLFLALNVTFFVCIWNILGATEWICAKFTEKTCLVPRSHDFECQGHQGQKVHCALTPITPGQRRNGMRWLQITSCSSRRDHSVAAGGDFGGLHGRTFLAQVSFCSGHCCPLLHI